jgi:hypothetical protein
MMISDVELYVIIAALRFSSKSFEQEAKRSGGVDKLYSLRLGSFASTCGALSDRLERDYKMPKTMKDELDRMAAQPFRFPTL